MIVCTENLIRIDCVTESPNVNGDVSVFDITGFAQTLPERSLDRGRLAIALDRCGWMIVPQPQFGDRRWFKNYPSDACPEWADKHVPKEPTAPWPRLRVIDGGKNKD